MPPISHSIKTTDKIYYLLTMMLSSKGVILNERLDNMYFMT